MILYRDDSADWVAGGIGRSKLHAIGSQFPNPVTQGSQAKNPDLHDILAVIAFCDLKVRFVPIGIQIFSNKGRIIQRELARVLTGAADGGFRILSGGLSNVEQITNMDDDFGLIPFPHSDSQKQYRSNVDWNYTVMMVPKNPKNQKATDVEAQNTGKFLEAFAYLSQDTMKAIKQEYADRHFRDDESSDMLSIIEKGLKMDAAQIFGGQSLWPIHDGTFRVMYETIGDNKDPQTLVDERKKAAITELEKQLAKIK